MTLGEYEALARRLAATQQRLGENRLTRPLFNTKRLARHIEAAYVRMWERSESGLPPELFNVRALS